MYDYFLTDWSGVFSVDFPIVFRAVNMVFTQLGVRPLTAREFREKAELPIAKFWEKMIPGIPVEQASKMLRAAWLELGMQPRPFRGSQDVLWLFHMRGIKTIVVSSHYCNEVKKEAARYRVYPYIWKIRGCVKDKVRAAKELVEKYGINPGRTLVAGDMAHDIEMGLAIGAKRVIGLTCGYDTKEKLLAAGAHCVFDYPTELSCLIS